MLNKLYKARRNPAHTLSVARAKVQLNQEYKNWVAGLPDCHVEAFVEQGLEPFLKRRGYHPGYVTQTITKACKEWAFAHVRIRRNGPDCYDRFFIKTANTGGEEEFDWYTLKIPFEEWEALAAEWWAPEFLDDSEAGYAQIIDLAQFAWQMIHLESSSSHLHWKAKIEGYEQDDDYHPSSAPQATEDTSAYGGDRRTL